MSLGPIRIPERRKNADGGEFPCKTETETIIGCAFDVLNELGHGLHEKPYENALVVEFGLRRIPFEQQRRFEIRYKSFKVGDYIPDLIAFGSIVVDAKVIDAITDHEVGKMLNYLKITSLRVGLILNFRRARLEWKRVAFSEDELLSNPQRRK